MLISACSGGAGGGDQEVGPSAPVTTNSSWSVSAAGPPRSTAHVREVPAATVIAALHHDNQALREHLNSRGGLADLTTRREERRGDVITGPS
ncbi:hypothetical protein [Actinomadura meyerae]|uniref:hypothetical protein n=1 Tax=Actinomadura meyerae TaxID=240840 RepID=UPI001178AA17|nr:hypothetical protein [Actinomadura meyerae]